jgi:hypothetical protein
MGSRQTATDLERRARRLLLTNHRSALSALPALSHCRRSTGLAQAMLDEKVCRPSLSPHRLFQRAVGYNFSLGWSA